MQMTLAEACVVRLLRTNQRCLSLFALGAAWSIFPYHDRVSAWPGWYHKHRLAIRNMTTRVTRASWSILMIVVDRRHLRCLCSDHPLGNQLTMIYLRLS